MDSRQPSPETTGLILGTLAVMAFSLTLPATRLAVTALNPALAGLGRSAVAAIPAALMLAATRQPWPTPRQWRALAGVAVGVVIGFPLLAAEAMQVLPVAHAAVMTGLIPLLTAAAAALLAGERPSLGFWAASILGSLLVLVFAFQAGASRFHTADLELVAASVAAALGYAEGARLAHTLGGWPVICWALVLALPVTWIGTGWLTWEHGITAPPWAWTAFLYTALVSQLGAFFLWYRALALGGIARIGQVQLLQPFFTIAVSSWVQGRIAFMPIAFALAVAATVGFGRMSSIYRPRPQHLDG